MSAARHPIALILDELRPRGSAAGVSREAVAPGRGFQIAKRVVDVAGALAMLAAVTPVMLGCAAWIKSRDGGPALYAQWRVGRDGWLFRIYKLRTMAVDAESGGAQFARRRDPRVLPGCEWMRKSHLDELPQLVNILRGEMSLVGPRPERPEVIERLRAELPGVERRLAAAPGLTGLAQVNHGYANDLRGLRRKLAYDLLYLRRRSVMGDARLLLATLPKFWDRSAC